MTTVASGSVSACDKLEEEGGAGRRLAPHLADVRSVVDPRADDGGRKEHGTDDAVHAGQRLGIGVVDEAAQQRAEIGVVQPELVDERVQLVAVPPRGDGRAVGARNGYETHR